MSYKTFDYTLIPGQRLLICIMCALTEGAILMTLQRSVSFNEKKLYFATNALLCNVFFLLCVCVFMKHLLCSRQHARNWGYTGE